MVKEIGWLTPHRWMSLWDSSWVIGSQHPVNRTDHLQMRSGSKTTKHILQCCPVHNALWCYTRLQGAELRENLLSGWLIGSLSPVETTKDYIRAENTLQSMEYIRAENKLQSISKLSIPQVIIPQASFSQTTTQILSMILESKPRKTLTHVLEPVYIPVGTQYGNLDPAG